jgi:hypothetical protein
MQPPVRHVKCSITLLLSNTIIFPQASLQRKYCIINGGNIPLDSHHGETPALPNTCQVTCVKAGTGNPSNERGKDLGLPYQDEDQAAIIMKVKILNTRSRTQ